MKKFESWRIHFANNKPYVNWKETHVLSKDELSAIYKSIRVFQKGESSEAKNLLKKASDYVSDQEDQSYFPALQQFIYEENRHSDELGRFMKLHNIPKLEEHWEDNLFRGLRKWSNLEGSINVLLTAEIMSGSFYNAMFCCTQSNLLKQICTNILVDEDKHIAFQSISLAMFYKKRNFLQRQLMHATRAVFLCGSISLVWVLHRAIFKKAHYTFGEFFSECFATFERTINIIEYECAQDRVKLPEFVKPAFR